MTQSEALRLADELDELDRQFSRNGLCGDAAAELRCLVAQRDALLEFAEYVEAIDPGNPAPLFEKAREAIKKAEGSNEQET